MSEQPVEKVASKAITRSFRGKKFNFYILSLEHERHSNERFPTSSIHQCDGTYTSGPETL
jgi:hypothetical protein